MVNTRLLWLCMFVYVYLSFNFSAKRGKMDAATMRMNNELKKDAEKSPRAKNSERQAFAYLLRPLKIFKTPLKAFKNPFKGL